MFLYITYAEVSTLREKIEKLVVYGAIVTNERKQPDRIVENLISGTRRLKEFSQDAESSTLT